MTAWQLAAAAAASGLALLLAWRLYKRLRVVEERLSRLEAGVERLEPELSSLAAGLGFVRAALSKALESLEAEEALERLRRRRRRRYIVFRVVTEDGQPPAPEELEKAILRSLERLGGQLAVALGRVQLVYYHSERMAGIVRASHDTKYLVLAALGLVRRVGGRRALLIPLKTTGTIRRAKRALGLPQREQR
ncbi:MAG: hypothetical protein GXO15_00550 [Crenarchaeota archaeon]|nr:hypothetical protein [Thermoproteota archaeon]